MRTIFTAPKPPGTTRSKQMHTIPPHSLEYLNRLGHRGINLGLGPTARLLQCLDNPQNHYTSILVGGTNGKGSVAAILASILEKTGKTIGLYTSPHLVDFRERIRVNGRMIAPDRLHHLIERVREEGRDDVTFFEFTTALAFLHFCLAGVDIAICEVGMGGRLDATNLVIPEASVITNVSLEHREYLGNDLPSIAWEKGGIIKEGGTCITAATQPAVIDVLEGICLDRGARLLRYGRDIKIRKTGTGKIFYRGLKETFGNLHLPLAGRHQVTNAALALAVVEILGRKGWVIDRHAVFEGMRDVRWEGRLEMLCHDPQIIVDGAHNPAGMSALCRSLVADFSYERLICVFGVMTDKDMGGMLRKLAGIANHIILTRPREDRASQMDNLEGAAERLGVSYEIIPEAKRAVERALALAGTKDLICITGSLYLVGEIKNSFSF